MVWQHDDNSWQLRTGLQRVAVPIEVASVCTPRVPLKSRGSRLLEPSTGGTARAYRTRLPHSEACKPGCSTRFRHPLLRGVFRPGSRLTLAVKDLRHACAFAASLGVEPPLVEPARRAYKEATSEGFGKASLHAVAKLFLRRAKLRGGRDRRPEDPLWEVRMSDPRQADSKQIATKKPYEKPEVLFVERIETRAVRCTSGDATACTEGPIES